MGDESDPEEIQDGREMLANLNKMLAKLGPTMSDMQLVTFHRFRDGLADSLATYNGRKSGTTPMLTGQLAKDKAFLRDRLGKDGKP